MSLCVCLSVREIEKEQQRQTGRVYGRNSSNIHESHRQDSLYSDPATLHRTVYTFSFFVVVAADKHSDQHINEQLKTHFYSTTENSDVHVSGSGGQVVKHLRLKDAYC